MNTLAVEGEEPDVDELVELLGDELGHKVASNLDDYEAMAARDRDNVKRLARELRSSSPPILVPHLEDDVHDIAGLIEMNEYLFAGEAVPATPSR
jgi:DNA-binding transcriptional ArsR family regulator